MPKYSASERTFLYNLYSSEKDHALTANLQIERALHLLRGVACYQDLPLALVYYEKAINQNPNLPTIQSLVQLKKDMPLLKKLDVPGQVPFEKIFELAKRNYALPCFLLSVAYRKGEGAPQDHTQAEFYLKRAHKLNRGLDNVIYNLAVTHRDTKTPEGLSEARMLFKQSADLGNEKAMHNLACLYFYGQGGAKDLIEARKLFEKAADLGQKEALYTLAVMYLEELGGPKDDRKAEILLKKSADLGTPCAWSRLGQLYQARGDFPKAVKFYKKGVALNNPHSMYFLAKMYQDESEASEDHTYARSLFEKASELNFAPAMRSLAISCQTGKGGEKDYSKAKALYEKLHAQNPNDASTLCNLGIMYHAGQGCTEDTPKAKTLFEKAVALKNRTAMYLLATLYENEPSTPENKNRVIDLLTESILLGHQPAMSLLISFYTKVSGVSEQLAKSIQLFASQASSGRTELQMFSALLSQVKPKKASLARPEAPTHREKREGDDSLETPASKKAR